MNNSSKKATNPANTAVNRRRTLSRLMAIQISYQYDFLEDEKELEEMKDDIIENYTLDSEEDTKSYRKEIDETFLNNLITGLTHHYDEIDGEIANFLKETWSLESLDDVLIQILRCGTFELKNFQDIPAKVIIDEYVDITASFFDDKKITFANAMLDGLAKHFRKEEFNKPIAE